MQVIYVESDIHSHPRTQDILKRYPRATVITCQHYGEVFNKAKQNFRLQKQAPALILAQKPGKRVLPTPESYGIGAKRNYYFSHMLNCLYDCRYCFLQGMYRSANYVLFVNYEDFQQDLRETIQANHTPAYFFSGYDGDSLAMEPITGFCESFIPFFREQENAYMELRTKSVQIRSLLKQEATPQVICAFSFTPQIISSQWEKGVPPVADRIAAMQKLAEAGWPIGIRLDPIIQCDNTEKHYQQLITDIFQAIPPEAIHSVSLGPLRFPHKMFDRISALYPDEALFSQSYTKRQGHISYDESIEEVLTDHLKSRLLQHLNPAQLFHCHAL